MEIALNGLSLPKRWGYKFLSWGLIPGIYSIITFGYIGIPTNIQEMIRHQIPVGLRSYLLNIFSIDQWFTGLFITAFIGAIWGSLGNYTTSSLLKRTYRRILAENELLEQKNSSNAINCYELFSRYIYNNYFSKFALSPNERISLYKMDMELFLCVGRHSDNELFKIRPSRLYPRNVGCIEKIWQTGYFQVVIPHDPSKELSKWKEYNIEEFGLDDSTLDNMKMKSRSLQGFRIQNSQLKTVAVLVFESVNPDGLKFTKIRAAMTAREQQNLCHLLESLDSHMPSLEAACLEGF
ncbi:hypothetical protein F0Q16_17700 [Vibrio cholerae]|nr:MULTISPECIES: hypothetical protein [Vibrio]KAA1205793.1 hypothetical protein F0Q16_17700 [Vibrio cholerae]KAA1218662.1 hypothetical protein F0M23_17550 [Vibrio cholerae]